MSGLTLVHRGERLGKRRDPRAVDVAVVGKRVEPRARPALVAGVKVGRGKGVLARDVDGLAGCITRSYEGAAGDARLDLRDRLVQLEGLVGILLDWQKVARRVEGWEAEGRRDRSEGQEWRVREGDAHGWTDVSLCDAARRRKRLSRIRGRLRETFHDFFFHEFGVRHITNTEDLTGLSPFDRRERPPLHPRLYIHT